VKGLKPDSRTSQN